MSLCIFLDEQLDFHEVRRLDWPGEPPRVIELSIPYVRSFSRTPVDLLDARPPQMSTQWHQQGRVNASGGPWIYVGTMIPRLR